MSLIIKQMRWVVAAAFAAKGIVWLYESFVDLRRIGLGRMTLYSMSDYLVVTLCAFYIGTAWGILRWRRWGRVAAIALSVAELAQLITEVVMVAMVWPTTLWSAAFWLGLGRPVVLSAVLNCAVLTWLLLRTIRMQYRRQVQPA